MTKVNVSEKLPSLTAAMFPKADVIPFTITSVKQISFGRKTRFLLTSSEHGAYVFWANTTSVRAMVARLGDDDESWIGQTIPLVKVRTENPQSGEDVTVLWVAGAHDEEMWNSVSAPPKKARGKR